MNDSQDYSATGDKSGTDAGYLDRIFASRRSIRAYTGVKPDRDTIREIVRSARFAPNSCNLQHYGFIYIDDDNTLKELAKTATGKVSWAPALIVAIDDTRFSLHRRAGLQSLAAAVENIFLAATARGLGACWMAGFGNDDKIRGIVGIPPHFEITGLIAIGFPDPGVKHEATARLELDDYLHINKFEQKPTELITSTNVDDWSMEKLISYRDRIGSVYAPRKRISLYHGDMVTRAVSVFCDLAKEHSGGSQQTPGRLLDVASYDGCFIRALHRRDSSVKLSLAASDYSGYFLNLLKRDFPGMETLNLGPDHSPGTAPDLLFDFLTLGFKLEFLPDPRSLLENLRTLCGFNGRLFLSTVTAGSIRAIHYRTDRILRRANVYDRNKLYMFGPYRHMRAARVERVVKQSGWRVKNRGKAGRWPGRTFSWWWLAPGE